MPHLIQHSYGKSSVRLSKVTRHADRHDFREMTVDVELEGDFEASYTRGDNSRVIPTDTMKNTVYALARNHPLESIEDFALYLVDHFVDGFEQVEGASVRIAEQPWHRIVVDGQPHPHSFIGGSDEERVVSVTRSGAETSIEVGVENLLLLKTTNSGFSGFPRDRYTTLPETDDRVLATSVTGSWLYTERDINWNKCFDKIRGEMLRVFAEHRSDSVQQTLHLLGLAVFDACKYTREVSLELPNSHRILVNLEPHGLDNPNVIFMPIDEPSGMISGTLTRD